MCLLLAGLAFKKHRKPKIYTSIDCCGQMHPFLAVHWMVQMRWEQKASCFTLVTGRVSTGQSCCSFPLFWFDFIFLSYYMISSKILDRHLWSPEDRSTWLCWHFRHWFHEPLICCCVWNITRVQWITYKHKIGNRMYPNFFIFLNHKFIKVLSW